MQGQLQLFLAVLLAHLLGDFLFQSDGMIAGKSQKRWRSFLHHGLVHYGLAYAAVLVFAPGSLGKALFHLLLFLLIVVHLLLDGLKERLPDTHRRWAFVGDQALHVAMIALFTLLVTGRFPAGAEQALDWVQGRREPILWLAVVYVGTLFGGGYLIRVMLPRADQEAGERAQAVEKGGMYIGWLERFLTLTAVLAKSPTLIGLILTAKSIVRFKKLEDDRFAEYYLLGTFLSLALALVGGLVLLRVLGGGAVTALE